MRIATATLAVFSAAASLRGDTLKEILDRMDGESVKFRGVTADLKRSEYTAAFKETSDPELAKLTLMKAKNGVIALLEFSSPDVKQVLFRDSKFQEFLPKLNLIQVYDLGRHSQVVNEFVTLGFGASGKDIQRSYSIEVKGVETLRIADNDIKATKLELIPRSAEALEYLKRIEFWIPEGKAYAAQLKIHQKSGNTNTATYSDVRMNPATLNEHSVELKAPKNAKREVINK